MTSYFLPSPKPRKAPELIEIHPGESPKGRKVRLCRLICIFPAVKGFQSILKDAIP
jgi:hypothetical protein